MNDEVMIAGIAQPLVGWLCLLPVLLSRYASLGEWSAVIHPSIGWGGREPFAGMLCGEWATRPPYRLRLSSGGLGAPSPGPLRVL